MKSMLSLLCLAGATCAYAFAPTRSIANPILPSSRSVQLKTHGGSTPVQPATQSVMAKPQTAISKIDREGFMALKENLGIVDKDLSREDVLEIIALRFAGFFENADGMFAEMSRRIYKDEVDIGELKDDCQTFKASLKEVQRRLDDLEKKVVSIDKDLTEIYNWSDKINAEVRNEFGGGIKQDFMTYKSNLEETLRSHEQDMGNLQRQLNQLSFSLNQLRCSVR